ncbi:uncharacterized protein [Nicotiana tomentosiformis]|uniref:uncharacterized protein n=1 Tax=Nicotiana tomentosiformis TaxID=4098 RepID=UPI00051C3267|nr:uncharacterized protein LOC104089157 isoform X1 [Nicotiana tomentosiformis]
MNGVEDFGWAISVGASHIWCGPRFMTPVAHQYHLNTCVAFAVSDVVSAKLEMQSPRSLRVGAISFSKQEILECLPIVGYGTTFLKVYNYRQGLAIAFILDWDWIETYEAASALQHHTLTATMVHYPSFANRGFQWMFMTLRHMKLQHVMMMEVKRGTRYWSLVMASRCMANLTTS